MRKAKDNPYATSRVEKILKFDPELIGETWSSIEKRWQELEQVGIVLGCHGSGKTTFLLGFSEYLESRGEVVVNLFYNDQKRSLSRVESASIEDSIKEKIVLVDGEECLSTIERLLLRRKLRKAKGRIVAKHAISRKDQSKVLLTLEPTPELAQQLLKRLIKQECSREDIQIELRKNKSNLREMWLARYDGWAKADLE